MDRKTEQGRVTLLDIAFNTGTSVKTISLALRGHPSVTPSTAGTILQATQRLGYRGRRPGTFNIGIIAPSCEGVYGELVSNIRANAQSYEVNSSIILTGRSAEAERKAIGVLGKINNVEGVILVDPELPVREINVLTKAAVAVVNAPIEGNSLLHFGSVRIDNEAGAYKATQYLVERGHQRIAYLGGSMVSNSSGQKEKGYLKACEDLHISPSIFRGETTEPTTNKGYLDLGYQSAKHLLSIEARIEAIIADNDLIAIGAMKALFERRLRIPEDISVVGFDNFEIGRFYKVTLSTVSVQRTALAWETLNTLFSMSSRNNNFPATKDDQLHKVLVPDLYIRESVR